MAALIMLGTREIEITVEDVNDRRWDISVPARDITEADLSSVISSMKNGTEANMGNVLDNVDIFLLESAVKDNLQSILYKEEIAEQLFPELLRTGMIEEQSEEDCDDHHREWRYWVFSEKAQTRGEYLLENFLKMF